MAQWSQRTHWLAGSVLCLTAACALWLTQQAHVQQALLVNSATDDVCIVAPPTPHDPLSGVGLHDPRPIAADARCPVCGMFPARSPEWAAQVVFDDGATHFFDSPVSLFIYLGNVTRISPGRSIGQIAAQYVTDSEHGGWVSAQQAVYVKGSSALGPMRSGNLPAFAHPADAQRFAQRRGGELLTAAQITPALLTQLGGGNRHTHSGSATPGHP